MIDKHLIAGLLIVVVGPLARAEDKSKIPEGSPPRLVSILELKGDVVVYRDFYFVPPIPKKAGQFDPKEPVPSHPSAGPAFACAVEFPLKSGAVFDAAGTRLTREAARKRFAVGDTVLVSTSGKKVDPAYLRVVKKETLILVHPVPPPGPPLPRDLPKEDK